MLQPLRRVWFGIKERMFIRRFASRAERFSAIHADNMWKNPETASGYGSTLAATAQLRAALQMLIDANDVRSILDAPCGDFNWQGELRLAGHYTGLDIVPALIEQNRANYGQMGREFAVADIVEDGLPRADLVLCRECLNHLPLDDGARALANLASTANRFLLVTHYPDTSANEQQEASFRYRPLNLTAAPFNLRAPDGLIREDAHEVGKTIAIWDLHKGPVLRGAA